MKQLGMADLVASLDYLHPECNLADVSSKWNNEDTEMTDTNNLLYYGDDLDILRRYIKDETVDLVYPDPPCNSNATYNVLFSEHNGSHQAYLCYLETRDGQGNTRGTAIRGA